MLRYILTVVLFIVCVVRCDAYQSQNPKASSPEYDITVITHKNEGIKFLRGKAKLPDPPEWPMKMAGALDKHRTIPGDSTTIRNSVVYAGRTLPDQVIDSPYLIYVWPENEHPANVVKYLAQYLYFKMQIRADRISSQRGVIRPPNIRFIGEGEGAAINAGFLEEAAKFLSQLPQPDPEAKREILDARSYTVTNKTVRKYDYAWEGRFVSTAMSPLWTVEVITLDPKRFKQLTPISNPGGIVDWQTNYYSDAGESMNSLGSGLLCLDRNLAPALDQANLELDVSLQSRDWFFWQTVLALPAEAWPDLTPEDQLVANALLQSPDLRGILYGGKLGILSESFTDHTSDFFTPHLDAKVESGSLNLTPYMKREEGASHTTVCSLVANELVPVNSVVEFCFLMVDTPEDGIPCEGFAVGVMPRDADLAILDERIGQEGIREGILPIKDSFTLVFDAYRNEDVAIQYANKDVVIKDRENPERFIDLRRGTRSTISVGNLVTDRTILSATNILPEPSNSGNWFKARVAFIDGVICWHIYACGSNDAVAGSFNANYKTSDFQEKMGDAVRFFFYGAYKNGANDQYIRDVIVSPIDSEAGKLIVKTYQILARR